MKTVTLYTDGACSGNPGPGGWGAILEYGPHRVELSGREKSTTNNRMELTGVIKRPPTNPIALSAGKRHLPAATQIPKMGIRVRWLLSDRLSACYHFGNRQNQLVNLAN